MYHRGATVGGPEPGQGVDELTVRVERLRGARCRKRRVDGQGAERKNRGEKRVLGKAEYMQQQIPEKLWKRPIFWGRGARSSEDFHVPIHMA